MSEEMCDLSPIEMGSSVCWPGLFYYSSYCGSMKTTRSGAPMLVSVMLLNHFQGIQARFLSIQMASICQGPSSTSRVVAQIHAGSNALPNVTKRPPPQHTNA